MSAVRTMGDVVVGDEFGGHTVTRVEHRPLALDPAGRSMVSLYTAEWENGRIRWWHGVDTIRFEFAERQVHSILERQRRAREAAEQHHE